MTEQEVKLVIAALLHDIGKVIFREGGDKRKHSQSGYDYLKDDANVTYQEILNAVRYHHYDVLKNAKIEQDDLAYIVYIADNIASAADRREIAGEEHGFEITTPLQSVFDILNGNHGNQYYAPELLNPEKDIKYPQEIKHEFDRHFYHQIKWNITENLQQIFLNEEYINSLLELLEANLCFVPSSTAKHERADISLYDHVKITAAVSSCIYQYLQELEKNDYKEELFHNASKFYKKPAFLFASIDISGIQDFIYTIVSDGALKTLRTRSFYLEIMMEHVIDHLLAELSLSRANLIYSGGGHCYLLLPNTKRAKKIFEEQLQSVNHWLLEQFDISLFVAGGYVACNSETLQNVPDGSYEELFKQVNRAVSSKKSHRYSYQDIIWLNHSKREDYSRECKVCKRLAAVNEEEMCDMCSRIKDFSRSIIQAELFAVTTEEKKNALPLPFDCYLIAMSEKEMKEYMRREQFIRAYGKNRIYTGKHIATKLWIGEYVSDSHLDKLIDESEGIARLGTLRADVDNLGQTFQAGIPKEYNTLSRSATLSRQLSMFFKLYINHILAQPEYRIGQGVGGRKATIVYSGGDDLFIVGAWNDIIEMSIDITNCFKRYTQNTLSLSAGIGIYAKGYPISAMADEVAELEEDSKKNTGKDSVTLFKDDQWHYEEGKDEIQLSDATYKWDVFINEVIGEKYQVLKNYFLNTEDHGKVTLYQILELIRLQYTKETGEQNKKGKINFARLVYLLARLEPDKDASEEEINAYQMFSHSVHNWSMKEEDTRQLKTAIQLYAYLIREKEEEKNEN